MAINLLYRNKGSDLLSCAIRKSFKEVFGLSTTSEQLYVRSLYSYILIYFNSNNMGYLSFVQN